MTKIKNPLVKNLEGFKNFRIGIRVLNKLLLSLPP